MAGLITLLRVAVGVCLFGSTLAAAEGNDTATDPKPAKTFGRAGIIWPPQPPQPPSPPVGWPPKPPQPPVPGVGWPPQPPHPPVPGIVWPPKPPQPPTPGVVWPPQPPHPPVPGVVWPPKPPHPPVPGVGWPPHPPTPGTGWPPKPPHPPVPGVVWPPKPPQPPTPGVGWPPKPPHPPKPTCDVCHKLDTGFSHTLHYLQSIHDKVWDCQDNCPSGVLRIVGPMMPTADDDPSTAVCPPGYQVLSCRCTIENRLCDGVFVDGQLCTAYRSSLAGPAIQAAANCVKIGPGESYEVIREPSISGWAVSPTANCPPLYTLIECMIQNPWMPGSFVQTEMDLTLNACKPSSPCNAGDGCAVQALCKKTH